MRHLYPLLQKFVLSTLFVFVTCLILVLLSVPAAWLDKPIGLFQASPDSRLIISDVNIINVVDGTISKQQQIDIVDGHIVDIAPINITEAICPPEAVCVNANGAYAIPGLTDMHVHLYDRKDLVLNLAYGVTRVRNLRGMPMHLRWKKELQNGDWLGAELVTSSPILDHSESHFMQQAVKHPKHAKQLVKRYKEMGFDLIKVYGYIEPANLEAVAQEALKLDIPVVKHGPHGAFIRSQGGITSDLQPLSKVSDMQSLEHVEDIFQGPLQFNYDPSQLEKYIQELADLKAVLTPTLATFDHLTELSIGKHEYVNTLPIHQINPFFRTLNEHYAVKRWLSAEQKQIEWNLQEREYLFSITKALSDANIPLLVGSDSGTMYMTAGRSTIKEMLLMHAAGVPAIKVLQGATILPAKTLGLENVSGSIHIGKQADLVLLNDNPLADFSTLMTPIGVVKHGQWLKQSTLMELKKSANDPSGYYPSFGRLIEDLLTRLWH